MSTVTGSQLNRIVRAGAGAGKTHNLTHEVVERAVAYQEAHGHWPTTIVTTFTRKATQELRERIVQYCLLQRPAVKSFVQSQQFLVITTMHGLLDRFLRAHGRDIGLPTQFRLSEGQESQSLRKKILKQVFTDHPAFGELLEHWQFYEILDLMSYFERLEPSLSQRPTLAADQHASAIAIVHRQQQLLREILPLTVEVLQGAKGGLNYCANLQRLAAADTSNWQRLLAECAAVCETLGSRPRSTDPRNDEELKVKTRNLVSFFKQEIFSDCFVPEKWQLSEHYHLQIKQLVPIYLAELRRAKLAANKFAVHDLEPLAFELISRFPEAAEKFGREIQHWFIDEFQDTSPLQLEILAPMRKFGVTYMVGDPQQSIYLFRGARSEIFQEMEKQVREEAGELKSLTDNWRSQGHLLDIFNGIFPHISSSFSTMRPIHPGSDRAPLQIDIITSEEQAEEIEVENLVFNIGKLLATEAAEPKDIAVLCRTGQQVKAIEQALGSKGYPCISLVTDSYYHRQEIQDAMAFLQLLLNPHDDVGVLQFLRSPYIALPDQTLIEVIGHRKEKFWPLFKSYFITQSYEPGLRLIKYQDLARQVGLGFALRKGLIHFGFFDAAFHMDNSGRREANLWKFINLVEKGSREPGTPVLEFIAENLSAIELGGDLSQDAPSATIPNKITVMTVHKSKGLEFPYVFIPFCAYAPKETTWANFLAVGATNKWVMRTPVGPYGSRLESPQEIVECASVVSQEREESTRLLYVAMTRAKEKVFVSWLAKFNGRTWAHRLSEVLSTSPGKHPLSAVEYEVNHIAQAEGKLFPASGGQDELTPPFVAGWRRFPPPSTQAESGRPPLVSYEDFIQRQQQRTFGVAIHSYFEKLKVLEPAEVRALIDREVLANTAAVLAAFDYVIALQTPNILQLIGHGEVEWYFQQLQGHEKVEGRVDLWGVIDEILYVVDYKTGASKYKHDAFTQLKGYADVLRQLPINKNLQKIQLVALFPFEKSVFIESY